jgi:hypothetical protein
MISKLQLGKQVAAPPNTARSYHTIASYFQTTLQHSLHTQTYINSSKWHLFNPVTSFLKASSSSKSFSSANFELPCTRGTLRNSYSQTTTDGRPSPTVIPPPAAVPKSTTPPRNGLTRQVSAIQKITFDHALTSHPEGRPLFRPRRLYPRLPSLPSPSLHCESQGVQGQGR